MADQTKMRPRKKSRNWQWCSIRNVQYIDCKKASFWVFHERLHRIKSINWEASSYITKWSLNRALSLPDDTNLFLSWNGSRFFQPDYASNYSLGGKKCFCFFSQTDSRSGNGWREWAFSNASKFGGDFFVQDWGIYAGISIPPDSAVRVKVTKDILAERINLPWKSSSVLEKYIFRIYSIPKSRYSQIALDTTKMHRYIKNRSDVDEKLVFPITDP